MYPSRNIWFVFALFGWFVWLMSVHCQINAFESWIIWYELHYGDVTQGPWHLKSTANRLFIQVNTRINRYLQWRKFRQNDKLSFPDFKCSRVSISWFADDPSKRIAFGLVHRRPEYIIHPFRFHVAVLAKHRKKRIISPSDLKRKFN